jgi:hypothetical protein
MACFGSLDSGLSADSTNSKLSHMLLQSTNQIEETSVESFSIRDVVSFQIWALACFCKLFLTGHLVFTIARLSHICYFNQPNESKNTRRKQHLFQKHSFPGLKIGLPLRRVLDWPLSIPKSPTIPHMLPLSTSCVKKFS